MQLVGAMQIQITSPDHTCICVINVGASLPLLLQWSSGVQKKRWHTKTSGKKANYTHKCKDERQINTLVAACRSVRLSNPVTEEVQRQVITSKSVTRQAHTNLPSRHKFRSYHPVMNLDYNATIGREIPKTLRKQQHLPSVLPKYAKKPCTNQFSNNSQYSFLFQQIM